MVRRVSDEGRGHLTAEIAIDLVDDVLDRRFDTKFAAS
jgi:hypothetical protein